MCRAPEMTDQCCVRNCVAGNKLPNAAECVIKFYRFPRDVNLLEKWKKVLLVSDPSKSDRVCNLHFSDKDFRSTNLGWKVLAPDAVPSQNLPDASEIPEVVEILEQSGDHSNDTGSTQSLTSSENRNGNDLLEMITLTNSSSCSTALSMPTIYSPWWVFQSKTTAASDLAPPKTKSQKLTIYQKKTDCLKCPHCLEPCADRFVLLMHIALHTGDFRHTKRYFSKYSKAQKADSSKKKCTNLHSKGHFKKPLNYSGYYCRICGNTFHKRRDLKLHKLELHVTSQTVCIICHFVAKSVDELEDHVMCMHLSEQFLCGICERIFPSNFKLSLHRLYHGNAHECPECCEQFGDSGSLCLHLRSHNQILFYSCNYCSLIFSTEKIVRHHVDVSHHDPSPVYCYFCGCTPPYDLPCTYHTHQIIESKAVTKSNDSVDNVQTSEASCVPVQVVERSSISSENLTIPSRNQERSALRNQHFISVKMESSELNDQSSNIEFNCTEFSRQGRCEDSNTDNSSQSVVVKVEIPETFNNTSSELKDISHPSRLMSQEPDKSPEIVLLTKLECEVDSTDNSLLKCVDCNLIFSCENERLKHQNFHEMRGDFSCIECGFNCLSSRDLTVHYQDHVKTEGDGSWSSDGEA